MGLNNAPASPNIHIAKRVFAGLAVIFLLLFLGDLAYSLATHTDRPRSSGSSFDYDFGGLLSSIGKSTEPKNIAGGPDQKYERIAKLTVRTMQYDADLAKAQVAIAARGGLVQAENSGGLEGKRQVVLKIGVPPEAFEALREALSKLGQLTATDVTMKDMTSDYRYLLAEEERLALRLRGPESADTEERALADMEVSWLENVRVRLQDYDSERALCTVDFTLYEGSLINLGKEAADALEWAALVFAAGAGIALLAVLLSLAVAALWNHMKNLGQKTGEQQETPLAPL